MWDVFHPRVMKPMPLSCVIYSACVSLFFIPLTVARTESMSASVTVCLFSCQVWQIRVDVHVLNHDGNLMDAASLAAITALSHFRRPDVGIHGEEVTVVRTPLWSSAAVETKTMLHFRCRCVFVNDRSVGGGFVLCVGLFCVCVFVLCVCVCSTVQRRETSSLSASTTCQSALASLSSNKGKPPSSSSVRH